MRNRVTNAFEETDRLSAPGGRPWQVDGRPEVRLVWLCSLFIFPLLVVTGRLVQLHGALKDEPAERVERTKDSFEPVPSRDGRILSADGRVLAYDVQRYDVDAHYRWLESPADENWLRQRALAQLGRADRRRPERIAAERQQVIAQRDNLWKRFGQLAGVSMEELAESRRRVQQRVERIVKRVQRRRHERNEESNSLPTRRRVAADDSLWQVGWKTLVLTLTTTPRRPKSDPVIIEEELAHHEILRNVSREVAAEIEAHPERYPGLRVRVSSSRVYPAHSVAAHVIGNRLPISDEERQARKAAFPNGDPLDYQPGDRIGKTGVERSYDRHLRGVRGVRRVTRNRRGEIVRSRILNAPRVGRDVMLTLHLPLQERMESVLDELTGPPETAGTHEADAPFVPGGVIVALDVHTGAVLVAASAPRFDLNLLADPDPQAWRAAAADPARPFFSRATQMMLPPGSVYKTLTSVALLESGRFDPDEKVFCQGYLDNPNHHRCYIFRHFGAGHNELDLTDAICRSCNVYFFTGARKIGPEAIVDWSRRFGFGRPTGIDLPGERGGNVPAPPEMDSLTHGERGITTSSNRKSEIRNPKSEIQNPWYPGDTLGLAIGQSRLTVTPLQIARMMATIANDGYLVTPHVVRDFGPSFDGGRQPDLSAQREPKRVAGLNPATLSRLREGLEKVVSHPRGTGYKHVRLSEIAIAGKTGTAEVAGAQGDHAWFAGYVPADNPRIAFAVVLQHAGSGGRVAGPVAKQLVQAMLELGILEPTRMARRE